MQLVVVCTGSCIDRMNAYAPRAILERRIESFALCCSFGARLGTVANDVLVKLEVGAGIIGLRNLNLQRCSLQTLLGDWLPKVT